MPTGGRGRSSARSVLHPETFASWVVMSGLSLAQTGALLGHKLSQTALRYADPLTEAVREYSQKTASLIAAE